VSQVYLKVNPELLAHFLRALLLKSEPGRLVKGEALPLLKRKGQLLLRPEVKLERSPLNFRIKASL